MKNLHLFPYQTRVAKPLAVMAAPLALFLALNLAHSQAVATMHCPPAPSVVVSHGHWVPIFYHVHEDLLQSDLASFRFRDWRYTANIAQCDGSSPTLCPHVGEAIYERRRSEGLLTMNTATHLILVHTPEQ